MKVGDSFSLREFFMGRAVEENGLEGGEGMLRRHCRTDPGEQDRFMGYTGQMGESSGSDGVAKVEGGGAERRECRPRGEEYWLRGVTWAGWADVFSMHVSSPPTDKGTPWGKHREASGDGPSLTDCISL